MATTTLTTTNFDPTIAKGITLVDWWAPWCGPCRSFAPVFEHVSNRHPDVVFGKVNTDAEPALGQSFEVQAIPTIMAFRAGILVYDQAGMVSGAVLDKIVEKVKALDMDDVRQRLQG